MGLGSYLSRNKMFRLRFHRQSHPSHNILSTGQQRRQVQQVNSSNSNNSQSSSNIASPQQQQHHEMHQRQQQQQQQQSQSHHNHYQRLFSSVHWTQVGHYEDDDREARVSCAKNNKNYYKLIRSVFFSNSRVTSFAMIELY